MCAWAICSAIFISFVQCLTFPQDGSQCFLVRHMITQVHNYHSMFSCSSECAHCSFLHSCFSAEDSRHFMSCLIIIMVNGPYVVSTILCNFNGRKTLCTFSTAFEFNFEVATVLYFCISMLSYCPILCLLHTFTMEIRFTLFQICISQLVFLIPLLFHTKYIWSSHKIWCIVVIWKCQTMYKVV